ncbi:MAG TPA: peptidylprolyl isomerase [Candidatus Angelobacter sp.]|jgi:parvulin-like peptidyl-prolyl isomerase|nr:peptidylprolyl isomerase [Candidatus Angelobacter sp.]
MAVRRCTLGFLIAGILWGCSPPGVTTPFSEPAAAVVDGHVISVTAYRQRLEVSRHRDPFLGIPEAGPSPLPAKRLEDFTIDQLIREEIMRQEADRRKLMVTDQAVQARIDSLESRAGDSTFRAALDRNGFTTESFRSYERALLTEVTLVEAMAKDRIQSAMQDLKNGDAFAAVAARWSDDSGTSNRGGEVGWLRPEDIPERPLASEVESLATGSTSDIVRTNRGFAIATVLGRQSDQVHLAVILVLAPTVDLFSPQGTPSWFTKFLADRESALQRDGKLQVKVGSHART